MKKRHQTISGLISCHMCLVPLQFLLCPRFSNRNALIPSEQCLAVCIVTLAPYSKAEPPSTVVIHTAEAGAHHWFEGGGSQPGLQAGRLQHSGTLATLESCMPSQSDMTGLTHLALQTQVPTQGQLLNVRKM